MCFLKNGASERLFCGKKDIIVLNGYQVFVGSGYVVESRYGFDLHVPRNQYCCYYFLRTGLDFFFPRANSNFLIQMLKNLPVMQKTQDQSLGWEDPLAKGMATTPVFLPGEFYGQRSLASLPDPLSMGLQRIRRN